MLRNMCKKFRDLKKNIRKKFCEFFEEKFSVSEKNFKNVFRKISTFLKNY